MYFVVKFQILLMLFLVSMPDLQVFVMAPKATTKDQGTASDREEEDDDKPKVSEEQVLNDSKADLEGLLASLDCSTMAKKGKEELCQRIYNFAEDVRKELNHMEANKSVSEQTKSFSPGILALIDEVLGKKPNPATIVCTKERKRDKMERIRKELASSLSNLVHKTDEAAAAAGGGSSSEIETGARKFLEDVREELEKEEKCGDGSRTKRSAGEVAGVAAIGTFLAGAGIYLAIVYTIICFAFVVCELIIIAAIIYLAVLVIAQPFKLVSKYKRVKQEKKKEGVVDSGNGATKVGDYNTWKTLKDNVIREKKDVLVLYYRGSDNKKFRTEKTNSEMDDAESEFSRVDRAGKRRGPHVYVVTVLSKEKDAFKADMAQLDANFDGKVPLTVVYKGGQMVKFEKPKKLFDVTWGAKSAFSLYGFYF